VTDLTSQNRLEMWGRRQFLGVAAGTLAAAELAPGRSAGARLFAHRAGDLENRLGLVLVNSG